jgi:D-glycero-beta-D-manno-heptose-7-phosphate kinase
VKLTRQHLEKFAASRILVVGDVMLDHFIWGNVRRISPEAPVPVVEVVRETSFPGGAANVARNLAMFTRHTSLMGRVGLDAEAGTLRELLMEEGVQTGPLINSPELPTISKSRIIARQQQVVRVDRERLEKLTEDELAVAKESIGKLLPQIDAIIIEDYGKGFVTQPLVEMIVSLAGAAKKLVTVDPSPRNPLQWHGVTLVKPNRIEAFAAAGVEDHHRTIAPEQDEELIAVGSKLLSQWRVPGVLITLGEQGMMLFQQAEKPYHIPTRAREVYDVSGAGDTAIALLTLALAAGLSPVDAADVANQASGIVVGKLGTASLTPAELLGAYH